MITCQTHDDAVADLSAVNSVWHGHAARWPERDEYARVDGLNLVHPWIPEL
jgi:hypothetical protein